MNNNKQFIKELKELLKKHNARIKFEVGFGSDTHGLHNERIVIINDKGKEIAESYGWSMSHRDL